MIKFNSKITHTAEIEKFSHDGRGIAKIEGKTTFIEGALPEETVTFYYTRKKSDFDEGRAIEIIKASAARVQPGCAHYALCGGCSLQHLSEEKQINVKQELLLDSLMRIGHVQAQHILPPLTSPHWHYRNKARLSVRQVKNKGVLIGFREKLQPRYIAEIHHCSILNKQVADTLPTLKALIESLDNPSSIAQIEVAAGDEQIALIFRHLNLLTPSDEEKLKLFSDNSGFILFLQSGGPETVQLFYPLTLENEYLNYSLQEYNIHYQFKPTDFTQVNSILNQKMIKQTLELLELNKQDQVLDLFCGLGNFTLPIARQCAYAVGIEGSKESVERAIHNAARNHIENINFYTGDLEQVGTLTPHFSMRPNKLLLDPPRSGALTVVQSISLFYPKKIVYVSCNPATLARDSGILVHENGYTLSKIGVMDMFPHTAHVESVAVFERE